MELNCQPQPLQPANFFMDYAGLGSNLSSLTSIDNLNNNNNVSSSSNSYFYASNSNISGSSSNCGLERGCDFYSERESGSASGSDSHQ